MPSNVDLESIRFSLKKLNMAIYTTISRTSTSNGMAGFKTEADKTYLLLAVLTVDCSSYSEDLLFTINFASQDMQNCLSL